MSKESENIIDARGLSCRFGSTDAVDGLDLRVGNGSIHAFLGPNGAGKTTTIKMLMGILFPTGGSATVLGRDSQRLGRTEFEKIGYVSENQDMPTWMTVEGLMNYCRPFYPTWDDAFCDALLGQFALPRDRRLKHLSRGMQMKAALVSSLAYRPTLLVLDEPFSGLDPLVREEFIEGMLELTEQESWTIFISSHDIDEVERLADHVGIINMGRLHLSEPVESLQRRFRKISVTTSTPDAHVPVGVPSSWLRPKAGGRALEFVASDYDAERTEIEVREHVSESARIEEFPMSLKEIYLALARGFQQQATAAANP